MLLPLTLGALAIASGADSTAAAQQASATDSATQSDASLVLPALHAGGVLVGMRISVSLLWPEAYDPTRRDRQWAHLRAAYARPPEWRRDRAWLESDGDPWQLNALGHALFGSEIYGRARQCGHGPLGAALFTIATSALWEYALEAPYKRPSGIDLIWTPAAGALVGEARFRLHRWLGGRSSLPGLVRSALQVLIDPFGEGERHGLRTRC